jgi:hypothetical protein
MWGQPPRRSRRGEARLSINQPCGTLLSVAFDVAFELDRFTKSEGAPFLTSSARSGIPQKATR